MVYFFRKDDGLIKIGTSDRVAERLAELQKHHGLDLEFLLSIPGSHPTERAFHKRFWKEHKYGEWFAISIGQIIDTIVTHTKDIRAFEALHQIRKGYCEGLANEYYLRHEIRRRSQRAQQARQAQGG